MAKAGFVALFTVLAGAGATVFMVHRNQTKERQAMREAVKRDIEKLGR
tara:strand:+ start:788 stop:931 length:144 start_codon:yes stop_codon:yes gene_type:complete